MPVTRCNPCAINFAYTLCTMARQKLRQFPTHSYVKNINDALCALSTITQQITFSMQSGYEVETQSMEEISFQSVQAWLQIIRFSFILHFSLHHYPITYFHSLRYMHIRLSETKTCLLCGLKLMNSALMFSNFLSSIYVLSPSLNVRTNPINKRGFTFFMLRLDNKYHVVSLRGIFRGAKASSQCDTMTRDPLYS